MKVILDLPIGQNLYDLVGAVIVHRMEKEEIPIIPDPNEAPALGLVGYVALGKTLKHLDYETLHFLVDPDVLIHFCSFAFRYNAVICNDVYEPGNKLCSTKSSI